MADRTVSAIFEARVSGAQKGMRDLAQDVDKAGKKADELGKDLKALDGVSAKPEIDLAIEAAEREIADIKADLDRLSSMEATPEVTADIAAAERKLGEAESSLRALQGQKAELQVTADTSQAEGALEDLGDAGDGVGDDIGGGMVAGILGALAAIPIAGAVIGVGKAIAGGIIQGIQDGLAIEAERDLFSARTGLDEATSAKFGRAAGEAYANAWGDSVAANLETARIALEQGLIDEEAIASEIQGVIESLSGISDIMQEDIPAAARAAGQMIKTGLADSADEAFDILISGFRNGANASDDFLDTLTEYSSFFQQMGIDGQTATGLLIQGLEGGAVSADKVADALKEVVVSFTTGDAAALRWAEVTGESWEKVAAAFNEGGPAAEEALHGVFEALSAIEDPALRSQLALELTKSAGEDLGLAFQNINLATAADELEQVGSSAGSAAEALATMSNNTATQMEVAKRNVEIAMDGIKGALAAAFSDEISGAAEWVSKNRAPLMQFFSDVFNGAIDAGKGFAEFSATALDAIAGIADGMASLVDAIPGGNDLAESLRGVADSARTSADTIRTEIPAALDEVADKFNNWVDPEIMQARVHDATVAMAADFDAFLERVNTADGTVTINGDTIPAEDVLDVLVGHINAEDGTVTINGDKVPADQALDTLLDLINSSEEDVTIGGDTTPGRNELEGLRQTVRDAEDYIQISGDITKGRAQTEALKQKVRETEESIQVNADTSSADRTIDSFIFRNRTVYIDVVARGGLRVPGAHAGGWVKGLSAGGWVPGSDPGYDNILWPLNSGGKTLAQPLAGGEYVVSSGPAAANAALLEAINAGYRPASTTGGSMRISGTLDLGGGVMGRVIGAVEMVEDFAHNAPMRSRMQAGVR